jgi:hypothetical protein
VLDLHSRRLLASATSDHPDADLACDAIKMAAAVRGGPAATGRRRRFPTCCTGTSPPRHPAYPSAGRCGPHPPGAQTCRISIVIDVCLSRHMGNSSNSGRRDRRTLNSEERVEWNMRMNTVLYFSPNGVVYETRAYTKADIAQLVHDQGLQCLTSADRQFDFWFTPSTRRCQCRANQSATDYC